MDEAEISRLQRREKSLEAEVSALQARLAVHALLALQADQGSTGGGTSSMRPDYTVLSATVEKSPTAMVVSDPTLPDNPIIFANQAFQKMSGYDKEELVGRNCRFLQGPGTDRTAIEKVKAAVAEQREIVVDMLNYRKDGTSFLNELHVSPVFGPDGTLRYFFGCQIDATSYRATSDRLLGNDDRWRSRFERLHEGFLVGELIGDANGGVADWRYLDVNEAWERLSGKPRRQAIGRANAQVMPDMGAAWLEDFSHVVTTGEPRTVTRWVTSLGLALEARIFRPDPGQFAALFQDVTTRLQAEFRRDLLLQLGEVLRQDIHPDELAYRAASLLGHGLGVSRAGYGTIDPITETIRIARHWTAEGVEPLAELLHFRDYGSYIDDLKSGVTVAIADTRADPRTAPNSAALEAIRARSFINLPVTEQQGFVALLYLNNAEPREWLPGELDLIQEVAERTRVVVERRRAEQALQALTASLEAQVEARTGELVAAGEQLRQSQKMEAVGQLTGGLAHDFNNLLTGITGSLELASTRIAQGRINEVDRNISAAQGAGKRAAALTHRLLAFSRRQTLDPKPTDINALVAGMEEFVGRTAGPAVRVEVVGAAGLWRATVDPNQLENALLNLCINARDAMPDGGRITIETANTWLDARAAKERDLPPGQYVSLSVSDTGTGMAADVIDHAFDPFFTTKPLGQGTGLGLSMIYGFARQSGGQVRIYSELGHGTTMRLYFPRHHGEDAVQAPAAEAGMRPAHGRGETVLIVDDEPTIRMLVAEVLQDLDYTAIEASDGPSALRVLQSNARIDLIITDVGLPGGMNGRQVADAGRVIRPRLKVLFITGYAENAVIGNGHLEHGMQVVTKPFAMDDLANRIRGLIEAG